MTELTFLGTGNFLAPGRYWNSFLLDGTVLVEPSPTALPNLRRVGAAAGNLEAVVISHFHPDHTFGWPFLTDVYRTAHEKLQLTYVEVDGSWQEAGRLRFRAVEVEHVPSLRCFGYLFDRGNITVGYSGDTHPCAGLDELASAADTLVLECNGRHPHKSHMDIEAVRDLHARFPDTRLVLTHLGPDIGTADFTDEGVDVPDDFDTLTV
jgi:ribonuclease Z